MPVERFVLPGLFVVWLVAGNVPAQALAGDQPTALPDAVKQFHVADDLEIELVLSEPQITQPVFVNFDERGRMWVVEYRQYPRPAGVEAVSHDQFWRAVYDKVPPAPPQHTRGADRITIHEDTDGDGTFDSHKTFIDGLNIVTAVERGRGGVWVLNPPYLLCYADKNNDDIPDGDPVVHLAGFGIEDTHSVANSLRWGPDGWLYGAQGSTVTGHMVRPGIDTEPFLHTVGQGIWRYHPETRRCEFFAEGGGNTFGLEFDAKGRLFSGHNGGDTRGFHYVQGGYLRKGFEKHGPLSNPYAFGYFEPMTHHPVERFTHNFVIYEGGSLPLHYAGRLLGIEPLQGRVVLSDISVDGSTFRTKDINRPLTSTDRWFKPVDIKCGPDGGVYLCDWSDPQIAHFRAADGDMENAHGRVYRLKHRGASAGRRFDLSAASSRELCHLLWHPNKWFRQTALRLLADRRDAGVLPLLDDMMGESAGVALEALWAIYLSGGLDEARALRALGHGDPSTRSWVVRLLGDENRFSPVIAEKLVAIARSDPDIEVRAQLAASARRVPADDAVAITRELLCRGEDAADVRQPLMLWWALEAKIATDREFVLTLFADGALWEQPLVRDHLLGRVTRRFAQSGTRAELLACAQLFDASPSLEHSRRLIEGFQMAFKGRSSSRLPETLIRAMERHDVGSAAFAVRLGKPGAVDRALAMIDDDQVPTAQRVEFIEALGETKTDRAVGPLLQLVERAADDSVRKNALLALQQFNHDEIGSRVLALYQSLEGELLSAAQTLLASRIGWALQLVRAVEGGKIEPGELPLAISRRLKLLPDNELARLCAKLWPTDHHPAPAEISATIQRLAEAVRSGSGDPFEGQKLFQARCTTCHRLFGEGGRIGPDLTTFLRHDVDTMLLHIVHPNAEIREGYENIILETKDGRTSSGFVAERDDEVIVVRGLDDQNMSFRRSDIARLESAGMSLMPEGLLDDLAPQQVRDLFAYLRATQPLIPPAERP